jgi:hypothetical protein
MRKKHLPIPQPVDPKQVADETLSRARHAVGQWSPAGKPSFKSSRAIVRRRHSAVEARCRSAIDAYKHNRTPEPYVPMGLYISTLA